MGQKSTADVKLQHLKNIEASQADIIRKQGMQMGQKEQELKQREAGIEIRRQQIQDTQSAQDRRDIEQSLDFAIRSLPWWNRTPSTILRRAGHFKSIIDMQVQAIVNVRKIQEDALIAKHEAVVAEQQAKVIDLSQKEPEHKEEGAELEMP